MNMIFSGGDLRVRWHEWAGLRDWMDCEEVGTDGNFVVINTAERVIAVPAHRIYGHLEIEPRPRAASPLSDEKGAQA